MTEASFVFIITGPPTPSVEGPD